MVMSIELAGFIRERRRELSISQTELSRRTGGRLSHTTIANLEKGTDPRTGKPRHPRAVTLGILAPFLETTYEYLAVLAGYFGTSESKEAYQAQEPVLNGRPLSEQEKAIVRAVRSSRTGSSD